MTKEEYENSFSWRIFKNKKPAPGQTVCILIRNVDGEDLPDDSWFTTLATYNDMNFYRLELDSNLNVLRKMPVTAPVYAWAIPVTPNYDELK